MTSESLTQFLGGGMTPEDFYWSEKDHEFYRGSVRECSVHGWGFTYDGRCPYCHSDFVAWAGRKPSLDERRFWWTPRRGIAP